MNNKFAKYYIDNSIKEIIDNLIDIAQNYYTAYKFEDLIDVNMDKGSVIHYSPEDRENHSFELGKYTALNTIKNMLDE